MYGGCQLHGHLQHLSKLKVARACFAHAWHQLRGLAKLLVKKRHWLWCGSSGRRTPKYIQEGRVTHDELPVGCAVNFFHRLLLNQTEIKPEHAGTNL